MTEEGNEERNAEKEIVEAAYGPDFAIVSNGNDSTDEIIFNIRLSNLHSKVDIQFSLPLHFPSVPLAFKIIGSSLTHAKENLFKNQLAGAVLNSKETISSEGNVRVMDVCQSAVELLEEYGALTSHEVALTSKRISQLECKIARFLIFSHHIMSITKRKAIIDHARELRLGGLSKIGFPGIVIVEGFLEDVLEYVRRIQRLRWQYIVVRGEEIEELDVTSISSKVTLNPEGSSTSLKSSIEKIIDDHRKLPIDFLEIENEGGMSEVGAFCREHGVHDLFMTAMKKT